MTLTFCLDYDEKNKKLTIGEEYEQGEDFVDVEKDDILAIVNDFLAGFIFAKEFGNIDKIRD